MSKEEFLHIRSITDLHRGIGIEPPKHPMISVIEAGKVQPKPEDFGKKIMMDLYMITMKSGDCGMLYGKHHVDFGEGVLMFTAPGQVMESTSPEPHTHVEGWMLFFHPDLIRKTTLGQQIRRYSFFSYETHEALHLSDEEKEIISDCVKKIEYEYNRGIDRHSEILLSSNLELMLNYSNRFYERQFLTRSAHHKDIVTLVEDFLNDYFNSEDLPTLGLPTVATIADHVNLSANYLGDLMKKETGKNVKSHIQAVAVDRAKTMLLNSNSTVGEIAYDLGFNYPHYFSRMFKSKTGFTPQKYREMN